MESYMEMKERHQREISNFPMQFAFGKEQFEKAMKKLGLSPEDTDKVCSLYGAGDIMLKEDVPKYLELVRKQKKEIRDAIEEDETGDGFIYSMFSYELSNHEYGYTEDPTDALNAVPISIEEIKKNPRIFKAFQKACKEQVDFYHKVNKQMN